jgi:uncharacterized membrane protein YjjP (DUF1212 family)
LPPAQLSVRRFASPSYVGGANVFVVVACVAFLAIASVLLLVPGVPAFDAQHDILDGHPTLGTARAVVVGMLLIFIATGVLIARVVLGVRQ